MDTQYDVIIGGGGSVLANRLSTRSANRCCWRKVPYPTYPPF
jgi:hypothetical protein